MKKILIMGLSATASEAGIRSWLNGFGPVVNVEIIRDGDAKAPLAIVAMDLTDGQASFIVSRIQCYWHDGSLVSARLLMH